MTSVRARLEDAVIGMLDDLIGPRGVRTVRPYAGEISGATPGEAVMRALNGLAPGILVTTERAGFTGENAQVTRFYREIEIVLFLVSNNQRGHVERNRGEAQIYYMAEAALERVAGQAPDLGPDVAVGRIRPASEDVVLNAPEMVIWRQSYSVTVAVDAHDEPAPLVSEAAGRVAVPDDGADDPPIVRVSNLIT